MKKKQWFIIELTTVVLAMTLLLYVMVPKFLENQSINTPKHIPDENFRAYLEKRMKLNPGTPYSKQDAAELLHRIAIENLIPTQIINLKGIEYFIGVSYLHIKHMKITELDISKLEKLTFLDISENQLHTLLLPAAEKLEYIAVLKNNLNAIELEKIPNIKRFLSTQNKLKALNTSNNPHLSFLDVSFNHIQRLDFSANTQLSQLAINDNPLTELILPASAPITTIILSNTKLERLPDLTAFPTLSRLDYRGNKIHPDDLVTLKKLEERLGTSEIIQNGIAWIGVAYDQQQ